MWPGGIMYMVIVDGGYNVLGYYDAYYTGLTTASIDPDTGLPEEELFDGVGTLYHPLDETTGLPDFASYETLPEGSYFLAAAYKSGGEMNAEVVGRYIVSNTQPVLTWAEDSGQYTYQNGDADVTLKGNIYSAGAESLAQQNIPSGIFTTPTVVLGLDASALFINNGDGTTLEFSLWDGNLDIDSDGNFELTLPVEELGGAPATVTVYAADYWLPTLYNDTEAALTGNNYSERQSFTIGETEPSGRPGGKPDYNTKPALPPTYPQAAATPTPAQLSDMPEARRAAVQLYNLGLFVGYGNDADGQPVFGLDQRLTRMEALAIVMRLMGLESEAEAYTGDIPFTDVPYWGYGYAGVAYSLGLTVGVDDAHTLFDPGADVTATQFSAFMLRALQYTEAGGDFSYAGALDKAKDIGLITDGINTGEFVRGDAVIEMANALVSNINNSGLTLIDQLAVRNIISGEQATAFRNMRGQ
jgi:hypothetical protein